MERDYSKFTITGKYSIPKAPAWCQNAVFYQIYPQTYYDTNADGIGDLKGIIEKLDYIKSLGVTAIWLNPFYESPFRDAGYDISDYYKVAPRYGTTEDAKNLFSMAKAKGIRIIVDFVPGHTSIDHPWFKASADPKANPYSNWYIWTNCTWFKGMDKYKSDFIQGYCNRDGNYMTNFFWHQPALNYGWGNPDPAHPWQLPVNHPDVMNLREELKKIMRHWLDMGASGFRIDMAGSLVKNDPDQKIKEFWLEVRKMLDTEYPEAFIVSEWSYPINAMNAGFHADFFHWFGGFNDLCQRETKRNQFSEGHSFFDQEGKGNITNFLNNFYYHYNDTKDKGYISIPIGNHDLIRINNSGRTVNDLEIISAFLLTMPGVPFIYYGDEIGMRQLDIKECKEGAYYTRAGARTPMQWDKTPNLGFSKSDASKLYFPVDAAADAPNVAEENNDPNSLLNKTRKLIQIRSTEKSLSAYAEFVPVFAQENQYPFIYVRAADKERILVVLNPANQGKKTKIDLSINPKKMKLLAGNGIKISMEGKETIVSSDPVSYAIFKYTE